MACVAPSCPDVAAGAAAMPKSNKQKVSDDDPDDKPSFFVTAFVFVTITLATVLTAVLIAYAVRTVFNWFAG
jgi:hypothetical protein